MRGENEAAADMLRSAIIAAPGNELVVADWSNIESRVLAWIARADTELEMFRATDRGEGQDSYRLLFASFFGGSPDDVTDHERQVGKVCKLAFGFGGGVGALVTMSAGYQMDLNVLPAMVLPKAKDEHLKKAYKAWRRAFMEMNDFELEPKVYQACDVLKQVFRAANKEVNQLRYDIVEAVIHTVEAPGSCYRVARCLVWRHASQLIIQMPSGRRLIYANPEVHVKRDVDPDTGRESIRKTVSYMTARGKMWRRDKAWAGLFLENIVQGIAHDVLWDALIAVDADAWTVKAVADYLMTLTEHARTAIAFHIHDEIALDVPKNSYTLERLIKIAVSSSPWAKGLPLAAAGWVGPEYKKG